MLPTFFVCWIRFPWWKISQQEQLPLLRWRKQQLELLQWSEFQHLSMNKQTGKQLIESTNEVVQWNRANNGPLATLSSYTRIFVEDSYFFLLTLNYLKNLIHVELFTRPGRGSLIPACFHGNQVDWTGQIQLWQLILTTKLCVTLLCSTVIQFSRKPSLRDSTHRSMVYRSNFAFPWFGYTVHMFCVSL